MTESKWLESADPARMLNHILHANDWEEPSSERTVQCWHDCASERKLRLVACACARTVWELLLPMSRRAVEVAERHCDDAEHHTPLTVAWNSACEAARQQISKSKEHWAALVAAHACRPDEVPGYAPNDVVFAGTEHAEVAAIIRDIIGNPFRPVYWSDDPKMHAEPTPRKSPHPSTVPHVEMRRAWLTSQVLALADAAYHVRCPGCDQCFDGYILDGCSRVCPNLNGGVLDPERLVILADALEEAGCDSADILGHIRSPGPHWRGCWAVDLLLGKE